MRAPSIALGLVVATASLSGCGEVCQPMPGPAASCVRVAAGSNFQALMVITPECGIVNESVHVASQFTGSSFDVTVDADGRSPTVTLPGGTNDQLELSFGDGGCQTRFCVLFNGPGPGTECGLVAGLTR